MGGGCSVRTCDREVVVDVSEFLEPGDETLGHRKRRLTEGQVANLLAAAPHLFHLKLHQYQLG